MLACGRGFSVATKRPPELDDFLSQRVDTFDCGRLPVDVTVTSDGIYQYAWFYLMTTVGLAWQILGVSWSGLSPLFGVFFGLVISVAYGLFRVALPPWVAALPAMALTASPLHLQNLPHLRDYAKAPFVLALILLLFWLVRTPLAPRTLLLLSAVYGALVGVGYGFRTDLLANIPPFVAVILLFLPRGADRALRLRVAAMVLAAATFVLASWPVTSFVSARGGCQWHVILLGLDDEFTADLDVRPAYYGWLSAYSDEYVHTAVNSFRYRTTGAEPVAYCSAAYDAASGRYLRELFTTLPADVLTRAYASVFRVLDLPFYWWYTRDADEPTRRGPIGNVLTYVAGTARVAVVVTIAVIAAHSLRLGLFGLLVVLYFGGYPSLQFSNRHYFHLEFFGWWAMAFLGWHALEVVRARWRRPEAWPRGLAVRALVFATSVAVATALPLALTRIYQGQQVRGLVEKLLRAPRVEVPMVTSDDPFQMTLAPGQEIAAPDDPTGTAYLDLHIDLNSCPDGVSPRLVYDPASGLYDFTGPPRPSEQQPPASRVMLPVYRNFVGVSFDQGAASCVTKVERLATVKGAALLPVLTLPPDWNEMPPHQAFRLSRWLALFRSL